MIEAFVTGLGVWTPWHEGVDAWLAQEGEGEARTARGTGLPPGVARRATPLARLAAEVLTQACGQAAVPESRVALVLGTVAGELVTTFETLALTTADPPTSSPLRFRNAVHNAALGHIAIAHGNTGYASALSADAERVVAMSILEALGWLQEAGGHVVVLLAEDAWPGRTHPPAAAALVLSDAPATGARVWGRLGDLSRGLPDRLPEPPVDARLADSPIRGALELVGALGRRVPGRLALSARRPDRTAWTARFRPGPA